MSGEESGFSATSSVLQLDPWDIAHLPICNRDEQSICIEDATDKEFDAWVNAHDIPVKENGISGWSFDDRCRLVNYALTHGYTLTFVDGTCIPAVTQADEEQQQRSTVPLINETSEDASAPTHKEV